MSNFDPTIFIIEGPDNCGKTHLARRLCEKIPAVYWHMGYGGGLSNPRAVQSYFMNSYENACENLRLGRSVVFDRHWPSDVVYSAVLHRAECGSNDLLQSLFDNYQAVYVLCSRSNAAKAYMENVDPLHPYNEKQYRDLIIAYNAWYQSRVEYCKERGLAIPFVYDLDTAFDNSMLVDTFLDAITYGKVI